MTWTGTDGTQLAKERPVQPVLYRSIPFAQQTFNNITYI